MLAAERLQAAGEILVRPQSDREGAARCIRTRRCRRHWPEQLEPRLGIGLGFKDRAIDAERLNLERLGDKSLLRQHVAATHAAVGLTPQPVTMKERRAVAHAPSVMVASFSLVTPEGRNVSL